MSDNTDIKELRDKVDRIDDQILDLFTKRMACARDIAMYKTEHNQPLVDRTRERAIMARATERVPSELRDYTQVLFDLLIQSSRTEQSALINGTSELGKKIKSAISQSPELFPQSAYVACQGEEGANSQIAADRLFKHATINFCPSFEDVFEAVETGQAQFGILPIENSTAGSVHQVYDLMASHKFSIVRAVRIKIDHNLMVKPGTKLEDITDIYSHPQAISQCSKYLDVLREKGVRVHDYANTAAAAKMVAETPNKTIAAISSRSCAELYNLNMVARNIQNSSNNYTRFVCISKNLEIYPGADRTSLMVVTGNEAGSLYKVLARIYSLDINLVKLENHTIPDSDFNMMFYFDLDCPAAAPEFQRLMSSLDDVCEEFRYLGSYSELV